MRCFLALCISLLSVPAAAFTVTGPGAGASSMGAALICKTTVTGKVTVDSTAFSNPVSPAIIEGDDCAIAIATLIRNGYEELYSNLAVGLNRVEYSFSNRGETHNAAAQAAKVAMLMCNTTVTGTVKVDAFTASDSRLNLLVKEQDECADAVVTIADFGLQTEFASVLAAPERSLSAYTDYRSVAHVTHVVMLTCNANTTGTFVVDGFSISKNLIPKPMIQEQEPCALVTARLANIGLTNIFFLHSTSLHRMIYAFTDHP